MTSRCAQLMLIKRTSLDIMMRITCEFVVCKNHFPFLLARPEFTTRRTDAPNHAHTHARMRRAYYRRCTRVKVYFFAVISPLFVRSLSTHTLPEIPLLLLAAPLRSRCVAAIELYMNLICPAKGACDARRVSEKRFAACQRVVIRVTLDVHIESEICGKANLTSNKRAH